jgi:hypothetical protein
LTKSAVKFKVAKGMVKIIRPNSLIGDFCEKYLYLPKSDSMMSELAKKFGLIPV